MMKENTALKLQLSRMREIEVTGPNGMPVYVTGMLDQGQGEYDTANEKGMPVYVTGMLDQGEYTANEKGWILHLVE